MKLNNKEKIYFSTQFSSSWDSSPDCGIAYLFALPKRFWSIKEWLLVNRFLKTINGFYQVSEERRQSNAK